jgi:hypothetical protein
MRTFAIMIEVITFKLPDEMTHERLLDNYNENPTHHPHTIPLRNDVHRSNVFIK